MKKLILLLSTLLLCSSCFGAVFWEFEASGQTGINYYTENGAGIKNDLLNYTLAPVGNINFFLGKNFGFTFGMGYPFLIGADCFYNGKRPEKNNTIQKEVSSKDQTDIEHQSSSGLSELGIIFAFPVSERKQIRTSILLFSESYEGYLIFAPGFDFGVVLTPKKHLGISFGMFFGEKDIKSFYLELKKHFIKCPN